MMIPIYMPDFGGREKEYAKDAIDSGWVSSIGDYVNRFEGLLSQEVGSSNAIAVCNGTVALHLALHCLDIGPGDEVIVPSFTYIASVNSIAQTGAKPVFAEVRREDWLLDVADVERKITASTKAVMPVHLYGAVCDPAINVLARDRGLKVIEDCAEVLGSRIDGRHVGVEADVATLSFFGNKTVTTGEGGAVFTGDPALAARLRKVKGQGQSLTRRYWHDEIGFNYRMTNVCAAIGTAQMERLPDILARKRAIAQLYRQRLEGRGFVFQQRAAGIESSEWLISLLLPESCDRDAVMAGLGIKGIDSRPTFYCAHHMPMYNTTDSLPISEEISRRGISLPSFPALTDKQIEQVCSALESVVREVAA